MVNKAKKQGTTYETNIVNRLNKEVDFKAQRFAEGGWVDGQTDGQTDGRVPNLNATSGLQLTDEAEFSSVKLVS